MPALPIPLFAEIVKQCAPILMRPEDRFGLLAVSLSQWAGFEGIQWGGNGPAFVGRLVYELPVAELMVMIEMLAVADGAALCQAIREATTLLVEPASGWQAYYQKIVATWSQAAYQLDKRFVQLTLVRDEAEREGGGEMQRYDNLGVLLAVLTTPAMVLLGEPGAGKTTLLQRLQLECAWAALAAKGEGVGGSQAQAGRVPFFVRLNRYRGEGQAAAPAPLVWLGDIWAETEGHLPSLTTLLSQGRLLLLLDGLNEMPHRDDADYRALVGGWQQFLQVQVLRGNQVVFSCRRQDYTAYLTSEMVNVQRVRVQPLTSAQVAQFLHAHLGKEVGKEVGQRLRRDKRQKDFLKVPFFLKLFVDQVAQLGGELPLGRVALLTGFVRQALRREVVVRKNRLFWEGTLVSEQDRLQIGHEMWGEAWQLPHEGVLLRGLGWLAYEMQRAKEEKGGYRGEVRLALDEAEGLLAKVTVEARLVLRAGVALNVIEQDIGQHEVWFTHQLWQEYFAGRQLAAEDVDGGMWARMAQAWRADEVAVPLAEAWAKVADKLDEPLEPLPVTGWEETALLAVAMTADPAFFVIEPLKEHNLPLAGRCAAQVLSRLAAREVADLQARLLARIGDEGVDLRARILAAVALGEIGDPRFGLRDGVDGAYLEPPLVTVAGGAYVIGVDDGPYEDEGPAHEVPVVEFELGQFLVTNREYGLFVASGGYQDERWWGPDAWAWVTGAEGANKQVREETLQQFEAIREIPLSELQQMATFTPQQIEQIEQIKQLSAEELVELIDGRYRDGEVVDEPGFWQDDAFNQLAQPVVGVSWYEAQAYCAWLTAQSGERYTLATEAEWEAAARGMAGTVYGYGDAFARHKGNTFETQIRQTTPVGVFIEGVTVSGCYDMVGNVWEWTKSVYRPYPYVADDGREDEEDEAASRVLRGGSWFDFQAYARAAYRYNNPPANRYYSVGFRVVRRRPPSHVAPPSIG